MQHLKLRARQLLGRLPVRFILAFLARPTKRNGPSAWVALRPLQFRRPIGDLGGGLSVSPQPWNVPARGNTIRQRGKGSKHRVPNLRIKWHRRASCHRQKRPQLKGSSWGRLRVSAGGGPARFHQKQNLFQPAPNGPRKPRQ